MPLDPPPPPPPPPDGRAAAADTGRARPATALMGRMRPARCALAGREPPWAARYAAAAEIGRALAKARRRIHSSRSRKSFSSLYRSYVGRDIWIRRTSARFSAAMRSRSSWRWRRLSEVDSIAAPNMSVFAAMQWSMTGVWFGVSRTPPPHSRVLRVGLCERSRIVESFLSSW